MTNPPKKFEPKNTNKPTLTLLGLVLDESGSMFSVKDDTIGSLNEYINGLRKDTKNPLQITLTQFNTIAKLTKVAVPLEDFPKYTEENYSPGGSTALNDAIGITIKELETQLKDNPEAKVLIVVMTDGFENASHEFNTTNIRALIDSKDKEENWTFVYLSADADAFSAANSLGFNVSNVANYNKDSSHKTFSAMVGSTNTLRSSVRTRSNTFMSGNAAAYKDAGAKLKDASKDDSKDDS